MDSGEYAATHVFHDVEEAVVHVGLLCELDLDLVQVGQRIFDVERRLVVKSGQPRLPRQASGGCEVLRTMMGGTCA